MSAHSSGSTPPSTFSLTPLRRPKSQALVAGLLVLCILLVAASSFNIRVGILSQTAPSSSPLPTLGQLDPRLEGSVADGWYLMPPSRRTMMYVSPPPFAFLPPIQRGSSKGSNNASFADSLPQSMKELAFHLQARSSSSSLRRRNRPSPSVDWWPPFADDILDVKAKHAELRIPDAFLEKARAMFANFPAAGSSGASNKTSTSPALPVLRLPHVERQTITVAKNLVTSDTTMFNELRRYRPGYSETLGEADQGKVVAALMANAGVDTCDFCNGKRVAHDVFGEPIASDHCFIASNVAKYEAYHAVLVAKEHNPLVYSRDAIRDFVATSNKWFHRMFDHVVTAAAGDRKGGGDPSMDANDDDAAPDAVPCFPHAMFDAGAKASASQPHQHWQLILTADSYMGKAEQLLRDAARYTQRSAVGMPSGGSVSGGKKAPPPARNFFTDWAALHDALNMSVEFSSELQWPPTAQRGGDAGGGGLAPSRPTPRATARVFPSLTPVKERELWVMADTAEGTAFADGLHAALDTLLYSGTRSLSMGIWFQPMGGANDTHDDPPSSRIHKKKRAAAASVCRDKLLELETKFDGSKGKTPHRRRQQQQRPVAAPTAPVIARLIDRGSPVDARNDVGAMEFFGGNNVGMDPFRMAELLRTLYHPVTGVRRTTRRDGR